MNSQVEERIYEKEIAACGKSEPIKLALWFKDAHKKIPLIAIYPDKAHTRIEEELIREFPNGVPIGYKHYNIS